jgi:IS5 family transposase
MTAREKPMPRLDEITRNNKSAARPITTLKNKELTRGYRVREPLHKSVEPLLCQVQRAGQDGAMKQADLGLNLTAKRTRKRRFLDEMNVVVPWADLVGLITPHAKESGRRGRQPFAVEVMLRIHFMQQWFTLSDPAMEEALHDVPLYREFAGLDNWHTRLPDESTILRFRHLLEKHKLAEQMFKHINELLAARGLLLKAGTAVDASLIAAPSSTKNKDKARDAQMRSSQKGNQWYFGMKV